MGYNRYSLQIFIRVVLIFITLIALAYFLPKPNRLITTVFFGMLSIGQVVALIRYNNRINYDFARFLIELKEKDTSELYFPESLERNFKNLKYSFQQISNEIKESRIEKLNQEHYLGYIIENIADGLISFDEDGKVKLINSGAKRLFQLKYLNTIWELDKIQDGLAKKLVFSSPSQHKLIRITVGKNSYDVLFRIAEVKIDEQILKVVSFQDLKKELEKKELSSWKKLIRVLTHEMMNSLTPITTLSVAARRILKDGDAVKVNRELSKEEIEDIYKNNEVIEQRSKGLMEFIHQYRQIARIPELNIEEVEIASIFQNIKQLFSETIKEKQIDFQIKCVPKNLTYKFDKKLIEQVIINLVNNSDEALASQKDGKIELQARTENDSLVIKLCDNGSGIKEEIRGDIFVPFFTTKKQGSGIGLSLSKEIMQKHGGDIYFETDPGKGTRFYLSFKVR